MKIINKIIILSLIMILTNACSTKFKEKNTIDNNIKKTNNDLNSKYDYLLNIGANDIKHSEILGNIYFEYNEIKLTQNNKDFINKNILILKNKKIYLIAYSNEWGEDQYNLNIGLKRLKEVKEYLIEHHYPINNIKIKTIGINSLVCNKNIKECLSKNRKIEFKVD